MLEFGDVLISHVSYLVYLGVSLALTVWVARALSSSGKLFLIRCFGQDEALAESTNRLLVIGFYLVNLGLVCIRLRGWGYDTASGSPCWSSAPCTSSTC
jgi:hypothetical protein